MYPPDFAALTPDKPAVILAASQAGPSKVQTYGELAAGSNRLARLLAASGLRPGDRLAILVENHLRYFELVWAGLNSGLYVTPVNSHLTAPEVAYLVNDSGAKTLISSRTLVDVAEAVVGLTPGVARRLMLDGSSEHYADLDEAVAEYSDEPRTDEVRGTFMLYSSGTTGRPKGIRFPLPDHPASAGDVQLLPGAVALGLDASAVYLSPAPLYHAAPLRVSAVAHCTGGTVVVLPKFDAEQALRAIEQYRVTSAQWVPTMFVRMLKLPPEARVRYDLSSMKIAVHAAAPCPVDVKRQMIEWWGPIIFEYYSGSENVGSTGITSAEWLEHPGSVGRAQAGGALHVCADDGTELAPGQVGTVYLEQPGATFAYHNDPARTAATRHPEHPGWHTLGDVGHVDADGYLYLSDRRDFTIIAGGVNIYPREIEDVLVLHDEVVDVAVFGIPHPELGEQVMAVVQPVRPEDAGQPLAARLLEHCRSRLAPFKWPRSVDFVAELPRLDNGKLYKRALRESYWTTATGATTTGATTTGASTTGASTTQTTPTGATATVGADRAPDLD